MLDRRTLIQGMALAPLGLSAAPGHARSPSTPSAGPAVLTVTGAIERFNADRSFRFDRPMLESLGITKLKTSTAWTAEPAVFEGVLARDLLQAVGAQGREVMASALNDYVVQIPTEDFYRYPVLLAMKMDGEYLKVRDKGPIWIVYPRDQYPELNNPLTDKKWIWQLSQLEVR